MTRSILILALLSVITAAAPAQNIYTVLHLNEQRDYKTARPKKIEETNTFFNQSGKKIQKSIKLFDKAGMIVSEERFDEEGKITARLTYTNDTVHRIVLTRVMQRKTALGQMIDSAFYNYDSAHFLTGIVDKTAQGNIIGTTVIVNNEKGLPVELTTYDAYQKPFGKETAEYAYDRNMAITTVYNYDGRKLSTDSIKISFVNAHQFPSSGDRYNEQGDPIATRSADMEGATENYEYEYEYDRFGNCLEEKIYVVTMDNGKKKRRPDRIFRKKYFY